MEMAHLRQYSLVGKNMGCRARWPGFKSHLCYLLAVQPGANCITSLRYSFLLCKVTITGLL